MTSLSNILQNSMITMLMSGKKEKEQDVKTQAARTLIDQLLAWLREFEVQSFKRGIFT